MIEIDYAQLADYGGFDGHSAGLKFLGIEPAWADLYRPFPMTAADFYGFDFGGMDAIAPAAVTFRPLYNYRPFGYPLTTLEDENGKSLGKDIIEALKKIIFS